MLAEIITIMVLELHAPHEATLASLLEEVHPFFAYVLSFIYVAIYWNNHHHLLHTVETVDGRVLWANNFLLFWLSLVPFSTGWMGESDFALVADGCLRRGACSCRAPPISSWRRTADPGARAGVDAGDGAGERHQGVGVADPLYRRHPLRLHPSVSGFCASTSPVAVMWVIPDRRIERLIRSER